MPKIFTAAEKADIQAMYRAAKNKRKQIGILAQLNACSKAEIIQVLGGKEKAMQDGKHEIYTKYAHKEVAEDDA